MGYQIREREINGKWKKAIFDENGNQISEWFDEIEKVGLVKGESEYFIAKDNEEGWAIFHKSGKQISDWFDEIKKAGLVLGESEYFIAREYEKGWAIFHKSGKQISDWFAWIAKEGLVKGESEYFVVGKNGKEAIFHKSGQRITKWFTLIRADKFLSGKSEYFPVYDEYRGWALFHKSGKQIGGWFRGFESFLGCKGTEYVGLLEGESDYFLALKDGWAIFHKSGKQVSDWFDDIKPDGLLRGENDFFIAQKDCKWAIFHKSGKRISDWGYEEFEILGERKANKIYNLLLVELVGSNKNKFVVLLCSDNNCKKIKEFENRPSEPIEDFLDKLLSEISLKEKHLKRTIKLDTDADLPTPTKQNAKRKIKL